VSVVGPVEEVAADGVEVAPGDDVGVEVASGCVATPGEAGELVWAYA
jgi:hypothetical protein